jgi:cytochrome c553
MFDLGYWLTDRVGVRKTLMSFQEHVMCPAAQGFARKRAAVVKLSRLAAVFLWLFASSQFALAQTTDRPSDTIAARTLACAPCHGTQGEGTKDVYFPRLAGKPAGYLFNQLEAFKNGRRHYPPMNYLLEYLTDPYLMEMAQRFAAQHPPNEPPPIPEVSQDVLRHGQELATNGASQRQIPACVSCHGRQFTGMEPGIPGLLGLRAAYISAQLGAFRYGTRTALAPDCMQIVAARLTEDDVKAAAAYLASLPIPPDAAPARQGSWPLPFACGSEPQ